MKKIVKTLLIGLAILSIPMMIVGAVSEQTTRATAQTKSPCDVYYEKALSWIERVERHLEKIKFIAGDDTMSIAYSLIYQNCVAREKNK